MTVNLTRIYTRLGDAGETGLGYAGEDDAAVVAGRLAAAVEPDLAPRLAP